MTSPTTCRQTTANANANAKKCHCQEENPEDNATDGVDALNGIGAINGDEAIDKAIDDVRAVNTAKASKPINNLPEVKAINTIKNAKDDINHYATALIHSLDVHENAMEPTTTAENTKKATPL
jgi:hypothetical protein